MIAFLDGSPLRRRLESLRTAGATSPETAVAAVPCDPRGSLSDRLVTLGLIAEVYERAGRFINLRYWITSAGLAVLDDPTSSGIRGMSGTVTVDELAHYHPADDVAEQIP